MTSYSDLSPAAALAMSARTMDAALDVTATLDAIVHGAAASVPGINHAGITTVDKKGSFTTLAATSAIVGALDQLQYTVNDGPCLDAIRSFRVVAVSDLRNESRWPKFVSQAVNEVGLRSQLALQMFIDDDDTVASLNLYSTTHDHLLPGAIEMGEMFAVHASLALGNAREITHLEAAVESRTAIGQATGILMHRYTMNRDRAFAYLARASSHSNTKIRDIANQVIDEAERAARREN